MVVGNMSKYVDNDESNFVQCWMDNVNLIPGIERKALEQEDLVVYYYSTNKSEVRSQ